MILNTHPNDRKEMVKAISELTGLEATYLYMPTCAYQIGPVTVNRNGSVTCDDEAMVETIRPMLIDRGWLDAEQETEKAPADSEAPTSVREMKLTMPIEGWTVKCCTSAKPSSRRFRRIRPERQRISKRRCSLLLKPDGSKAWTFLLKK